MSEFDDFLKAVSEAKQKDPVAQKVKEVKTNIKEDLAGLFSQISVIKEQDPVQQKNKKIEQQIQESVQSDLGSLFAQLSSLKEGLEEELVIAEAKQEIVEETIIEAVPLPVIKTPEERIVDTQKTVDRYLTDKSFQQPDPDLVSKNVDDIRNKIKFLEQAIGRIAAAGPGGGEVNLRWLDDVDRSTINDGWYLRYSADKKKFEFAAVSGGGTGDGATGLTGATGPQGATGLTGATGTGLDGATGLTGASGTQGINGASGIDGINGATGIQGTSGLNGLDGATGVGVQGASGSTGLTGSTGIQGASGVQGASGIGGATGVIPESPTGEPMGHTDRTQSIISFDDASRTFSISPVDTSYEIWTKGVKRIITDTRQVTIPDTTSLYYIYFDPDGVLRYRTTYFDWPNDCVTAYVYWNELTNDAPFVADERHGITLDWQTHEYLHRTRGAAIANGFAATNYIVLGNGSLDSHMQLDIASGTFFDEDLQVDVVNTNTPVANTWDQDLAGPAKIPMFYINSGGGWVIDEPTNFPIKQGILPKYNLYSGGVWTTPDIDNNKFGVTFIVATNNINYPIIGIIGQASHANIGAAESTEFSDLNLAGFPVVEMRLLYKLVYECKASYTNSVNARLTSVWDQRNFESIGSTIATYTDHGALGGLSDDDHPQYLLRTDAATVATSGSYNDLTDLPTLLTGATGTQGASGIGSTGAQGASGSTGLTGATGNSVAASYLKYTRSAAQTTGLTAGSRVICNVSENTAGSDITIDTNSGAITLAANKTYRLRGAVPNWYGGARPSFCWYNEATSAYIGEASFQYASNDGAGYAAGAGMAEAIITVSSSTVVSFRIQSVVSALTGLGGNIDFPTAGSYPWVDIEVISGNSPLLNGATGATGPGMTYASGYVNAGSFVTLDNIKATVTTSGNRGLALATVSGTVSALIGGYTTYAAGSFTYNTTSGASPYSITTSTGNSSIFGWGFFNASDTAIYHVNDLTNSKFYRITMMIGGGYLNNAITIERLI